MSSPGSFNNEQSSLGLNIDIQNAGTYWNGNDNGVLVIGTLRMFAFTFAPGDTLATDGTLISNNSNGPLWATVEDQYGSSNQNFALPDFRSRVMVGAGDGNGLGLSSVGESYGSENTTLTRDNIPAGFGGGNQPIDNSQPSLVIQYLVDTGGFYPSLSGSSDTTDILGTVVPYAGVTVPAGYLPADGRLLQISQYGALYTLFGTTYGGDGINTFALPDLQGRVPVGVDASQGINEGTKVGAPAITLTSANMPAGGSDTPVDTRQPSLGLYYIINVSGGSFPNRDEGTSGTTAYLGEVMLWAGSAAFIPAGWMMASGQTLSIQQNAALFSLLGTNYGGDGRTNFQLPNLNGKTVVGTGQGTGLSDVTLGQTVGSNSVTLTTSNVYDAPPTVSGTTGASGTENLAAKLLPSATLSDANLNGMAGGYFGSSITIARAGGANADDVFGFDTSGASFTVAGNNLQANGSNIATFTATGGSIRITFTGITSQTLADNVLQHITYQDNDNNPDSTVSLTLTFNDGDATFNNQGATAGVNTIATQNISVAMTAVNDPPSGASNTVTTPENSPYVFAASDFGFSDVDGNNLMAVEITTLPGAGILTDNGAAVTAGQFVSVADINGGKLAFAPGTDGSGNSYAGFTFQVQDDGGTANGGADTDPVPKSMTLDVTPRPSVTSVTLDHSVVNDAVAETYTITFSQAVTANLDTDAVSANTHVTGTASILNIAVASPTANTLTVSLYMQGNGTADFTLPAGDVYTSGFPAATLAADYAGPGFTVDNTAPTVAIISNVSSLSIGQTATITFTFSEDPGATFAWDGSNGDVTVSGGTLSAISGSGLIYTATFTPITNADEAASITVAAGSYTDAAGNGGSSGALSGLTFNTLTRASDFNGDGYSDLLWQNTTTGQLSNWEMNGLLPSGDKLGSPPGAGWTAVGSADFDGDGKSDVLLQNSSTNQVNIWLVDGHDLVGGSTLGTPGAGWKAVGAGDFNDDGHADVVLQNSITGQISLWLTDGQHISDSGKVGAAVPGFQVVGTGDFNGDGNSDLVLQNSATGQISIWMMNGMHILATGQAGNPGDGWHVVGTGDFNGDGLSDIVLQNSTTSQVSIWMMNGAHIAASGKVASPGTGWTVTGTGDFNDDGTSDILLQNSATGQARIWLMNGTSVLPGSGVIGTSGPGANFHVIAG